jgi:hypothetical protein
LDQLHLGLDHAELVLSHAVHHHVGVLRVLGEVKCPLVDAALLEVELVEVDLLLLQPLEFQLLLTGQQCLRVLPALLLEEQFLLMGAVLHGPVELERVALPVAAVDLDVDVHAPLRRPDLLVGGVLDGLLAQLVLDVGLVALQP